MNTALKNNYLSNNNLVLQDIDINVSLQGLMAQTEIVQTYANEEDKAIEALYTFPLPLDAVLLKLDVELEDTLIQGVVRKKQQALEEYEEAIVKSDTAVMLEKIEEGLFTLNLGNLLPRQTAKITLIYSQLHSWMNNELRYYLPTVIAQRYGNPSVEPQQLPETEFSMEHTYHFTMQIHGLLCDAEIVSPSHKINTRYLDGHGEDKDKKIKLLTLKQEAYLDRDLIINFALQQATIGSALSEKDSDGYAAIASFRPIIETTQARKPKALKVLIDCSGSMQGDSIELAKIALILALDELQEGDYFSIFRFGSHPECMTKFASGENVMLPASSENLTKIKRQLRFIDADLGGTEIFAALDEALLLKTPKGISTDIFLITDGEVWSEERITPYAGKIAALKQRVFTIGVGSAVSAQFVTEIAEKSGGASELLAPNEKMADKIQRHFKRIFMPRLKNITINWGADSLWQDNNNDLFSGDTYHVYAKLKEQASDEVILKAEYGNGEVFSQHLAIESIKNDAQKVVSRLVVQKHLDQVEEENERADLAVQYQLMDETTAYIMVKKNNIANLELPEMRKVPQMMAAGQAGFGSVLFDEQKVDNSPVLESASISRLSEESIDFSCDDAEDLSNLDRPAFLRRQGEPRARHEHKPVFLRSIENEGLSQALVKFLIKSGINYIGDLVQLTEYELQNNSEITDLMIKELKEFLSSLGLNLGMKLDNWPPENY